jgi:hypothetical protein
MSDTATQAPSTEAKATRNVDYTLEIVDELPDRPFRTSPLEDSLDKIIAIYNDTPEKLKDKDGNARWVVIGRYDNSTAAGAAANVLGQRHGKSVNVEGWEFTTRRIDEGDKTGLFVKYTPESIVPGAKDEWESKEKARKASLAEKRAAKKAAETSGTSGAPASASGAAGNQPQNASPAPSPAPAPAAAPSAPGGQAQTPSAPASTPTPAPKAAPAPTK